MEAGGVLVFEHRHDQGPASVELLQLLKYDHVSDYRDLDNTPRVCIGRWPGNG